MSSSMEAYDFSDHLSLSAIDIIFYFGAQGNGVRFNTLFVGAKIIVFVGLWYVVKDLLIDIVPYTVVMYSHSISLPLKLPSNSSCSAIPFYCWFKRNKGYSAILVYHD